MTFIIGTLATDVDGPLERREAVAASTRAAKAHFADLPRDAITQYTMLLMAPTILGMLTPIAGRTRPMFNVTVSNVPGPTKPLYFRGARMVASYPISLISHGRAPPLVSQGTTTSAPPSAATFNVSSAYSGLAL